MRRILLVALGLVLVPVAAPPSSAGPCEGSLLSAFDDVCSGAPRLDEGDGVGDAGGDAASARPLTPGTHFGALGIDDAEDWYAIPLSVGDTMNVSVSASVNRPGTTLRSPDGRTWDFQGRSWLAFVAHEDGIHHLQVRAPATPTRYQLKLDVTPGPTQADAGDAGDAPFQLDRFRALQEGVNEGVLFGEDRFDGYRIDVPVGLTRLRLDLEEGHAQVLCAFVEGSTSFTRLCATGPDGVITFTSITARDTRNVTLLVRSETGARYALELERLTFAATTHAMLPFVEDLELARDGALLAGGAGGLHRVGEAGSQKLSDWRTRSIAQDGAGRVFLAGFDGMHELGEAGRFSWAFMDATMLPDGRMLARAPGTSDFDAAAYAYTPDLRRELVIHQVSRFELVGDAIYGCDWGNGTIVRADPATLAFVPHLSLGFRGDCAPYAVDAEGAILFLDATTRGIFRQLPGQSPTLVGGPHLHLTAMEAAGGRLYVAALDTVSAQVQIISYPLATAPALDDLPEFVHGPTPDLAITSMHEEPVPGGPGEERRVLHVTVSNVGAGPAWDATSLSFFVSILPRSSGGMLQVPPLAAGESVVLDVTYDLTASAGSGRVFLDLLGTHGAGDVRNSNDRATFETSARLET